MKLNTSFIVIIFLFPAFFSANTQEKHSDNWNVKIGYSRINNYSFTNGNIGEVSVDGNYKLNKWLETGLYAGYSKCGSELEEYWGTVFGTNFQSAHVLSYGVNSYLHLSPLFFSDDFRLGFRIIIKPGGIIVFSSEGHEPNGHYFTFRPGVGIDYRMFRKIGLFGEYVYGFGDGVYRARDKDGLMPGRDMFGNKPENPKDIGSFRFGISINW